MRTRDDARLARDVGRRVAELRRARGLTQAQLAEEADVSLQYLQRVEAGRENLTLSSLARLARLLRVGVAALFEPPQPGRTRPGRPRSRASGTRE